MTPKDSQTTGVAEIQEKKGEPAQPRMKDEMASKARDTVERAREGSAETMRQAVERGESFIGEQKGQVADTIHDCCDALRSAANDLREKQDPNLASLAEALAGRLDRTSDYLKRRETSEIRQDLERFARNQPQFFYGGLFVAGLALARFFKSSPPESQATARRDIQPVAEI
jgi:hypothetical protein